MQLSKHFTLREMTNSMTAQRKGIDNTPGPGEIKNLGDLCYEVLEPLRAHFDKAVTITSGYRSEALCEAIGSKKTSQHALLILTSSSWSTTIKMIRQEAGSTYRITKQDQTENKY